MTETILPLVALVTMFDASFRPRRLEAVHDRK
jgi:hypothetical protein